MFHSTTVRQGTKTIWTDGTHKSYANTEEAVKTYLLRRDGEGGGLQQTSRAGGRSRPGGARRPAEEASGAASAGRQEVEHAPGGEECEEGGVGEGVRPGERRTVQELRPGPPPDRSGERRAVPVLPSVVAAGFVPPCDGNRKRPAAGALRGSLRTAGGAAALSPASCGRRAGADSLSLLRWRKETRT